MASKPGLFKPLAGVSAAGTPAVPPVSSRSDVAPAGVGHEDCAKAIAALQKKVSALQAQAESDKAKHTMQMDRADERISKLSNDVRDANTNIVAERFEAQREKEVLNRKLLQSMAKSDGLQDEINVSGAGGGATSV